MLLDRVNFRPGPMVKNRKLDFGDSVSGGLIRISSKEVCLSSQTVDSHVGGARVSESKVNDRNERKSRNEISLRKQHKGRSSSAELQTVWKTTAREDRL